MPSGTFEQIPIVPGIAHDLHAPVQAVAQQTPWAQLPEAHSVPFAHSAPFVFLPQELPLQTVPATQFASTVQLVKHRAPLQANGAQVSESGATQAPLAVQTAGGV
jgi:hypothetical protein